MPAPRPVQTRRPLALLLAATAAAAASSSAPHAARADVPGLAQTASSLTTVSPAPASPEHDAPSSADDPAPGSLPETAVGGASSAPGAAVEPGTALAPTAVRPRRRATTVAPPPAPVRGPGQPELLTVRGYPGAWYYRPNNGRAGRQRVVVYLHGRGSNVREHCRQLHETVQHYGWLLCPIGPVDRGGDRREWNNDRNYAARSTVAAIDTLVARFPRRARRHDNVMIGFSEGSYVGMNVALMYPRTFPRWFIIAPDDRYIDSERERIERATQSLERAYLLTGAEDVTLPHSRRAHTMLERAFGRRRERFRIVPGMGHQLPTDQRLTRNILDWLTR